MKQAIARQQFKEYLAPIGMSGSVQTLDGMAQVLSFNTEKDCRDWLARLG